SSAGSEFGYCRFTGACPPSAIWNRCGMGHLREAVPINPVSVGGPLRRTGTLVLGGSRPSASLCPPSAVAASAFQSRRERSTDNDSMLCFELRRTGRRLRFILLIGCLGIFGFSQTSQGQTVVQLRNVVISTGDVAVPVPEVALPPGVELPP